MMRCEKKRRSFIHGVIYTKKRAARQVELTLKVSLIVDRRIPIETKKVFQNSTQT